MNDIAAWVMKYKRPRRESAAGTEAAKTMLWANTIEMM
jgi:hypothetical protein